MQRDRITLIMPRAIVRIVYRECCGGATPGQPTPYVAPAPSHYETVLRIDSVDPSGFCFRARPVWPLGEGARRYYFSEVAYVEPWDGEAVRTMGPFIRIPDAGKIAAAMESAGAA